MISESLKLRPTSVQEEAKGFFEKVETWTAVAFVKTPRSGGLSG